MMTLITVFAVGGSAVHRWRRHQKDDRVAETGDHWKVAAANRDGDGGSGHTSSV